MKTILFLIIVFWPFAWIRFSPYRPLKEKKGRIDFFPKYFIDPQRCDREKIKLHLKSLGFYTKKETPDSLYISKKEIIIRRDFIKLTFETLRDGKTRILFHYTRGAVFDSGDLWDVANEVKRACDTELNAIKYTP